MVSLDHEYFGTLGMRGTDLGQTMEPTSLALDADELLYLADGRLNRISVFDRTGEPLLSWGRQGSDPGEFNKPSGLVVEGETVFVVDTMNHRVQRYTKGGDFLGQWGRLGTGPGEFNLPWGICDDRDGNVYVADWRNDRIQKFTSDAEHLATFGESGSGDGQFSRPADVAVDDDGNLYVADWGNQRLQVLDSAGRFLDANRGEGGLSPWAIEYLEAQQDEKRARDVFLPVYDVDTNDPFEISARIEPYFWDPCAVTLDKQGSVYVVDRRHRFQVFELVAE